MNSSAFTISRADVPVIAAIVDRMERMAVRFNRMDVAFDRMSLTMDIVAAHRQYPLRLDEFLAADDTNFAHDAFGIVRHMNRETALLGDCFVPRFARGG